MPPKDISLSADERKAFDRLFNNADTEQLGVLTGDKAVPFFEASELPGQVLGEIWALADDENTGFLTKEAFYVVCRLIGYAQRGQQPTAALAKKSGPLPYFKGMHVPGLPEQRPSVSTPQKQTPVNTGGLTITPEDKAKYTRLFYNSQPTAGLLDGEKARNIFTKSRLPNEKLGQIWNLADTQSRGALDATDFVIAMHLIHGSMNGSIPRLPDTLPVSLYAQAAAGTNSGIPSMPTSPIRAQNTGSPAPTALYAQPTGSSLLNRTSAGSALPLSASQRSMSLGQSQAGGNWAIDAVEKAQSDQFFDMLDTSRQGVLQGDVAVPFFVQSGLPEETLARIWDLSDIRQEGSLTKEEFAVARRLVMDVLAGKQLPDQLEQSMIPPSLRAIAQQLQNQPPQQSEVQRDLFSLMDDDEPSQLPPAAIASAASAFQPVTSNARVASPAPLQPTATGGSARSIPQPLGLSTPSRQDSGNHHRSPPPPVPAHRTHSTHTIPTSPQHQGSSSHSFFDSTPVEEKGNQIPANSAEIGNLQNQVREIQRSVSNLRQERTALSSNVAKTEAEIDELKSALAQAKAAFDTESTNMTNLESRFKTGSEELKKLREELIHAESELSALREQKSETEQNILKDKEEIRGLKINLKATNDEVATLKETLEKLRKEARQQKGLVVVSKKQLATSEADKEKLTKAIADEREQAHASHARSPSLNEPALAVPLLNSTGASPALSTHSNRSMNPFFAQTAGARVTSPLQASAVPIAADTDADPFGMSSTPVQAPQPQAPAQPTGFGFDDDFGSSFSAPAATAAPTAQDKGKSRAISPEPAPGHGDADFDAAFADFDKPVQSLAPAQSHDVSEAAHVPEKLTSPPAAVPAVHEDTASSNTAKEVEDKATDLTGSAAVGAAVGALAGAGAVAVHKVQDLFGTSEEEPERSVTSPSSMQPYESRQLPEEEDTHDTESNGDEELAPIRDVEQDDSDSDSDSEDPTDTAANTGDDLAGPFASAEDAQTTDTSITDTTDTSTIESSTQGQDTVVPDEPVHTGQSLASNPFPGAFPAGTASRPASSAGDNEEHFEDAHTEQNERSTSPAAGGAMNLLPASVAGTDTGNETEPLRSPAATTLEGGAIRSTDATKAGPTLGFDDAFDSPFKAMTPASHDSPAPAMPAEQETSSSNVESATAIPAAASYHHEAPQPVDHVKSESTDAFDDFEDLAPARVEEGPSAVSSVPSSARNADFDSNFDDDFGFDNQTFSHTNAQQPPAQPTAAGSNGFDDNFDSAFDIPAASPEPASTQAPALPARPAATVGFDDDFFSSPTEPEQTSTQQQSSLPQGFTYSTVGVPAERQSYDIPPSGESPAHAQQGNSAPAPSSYAPPAGPPPQQQQTSTPTQAPTLPSRNDNDGDLPQVKELVGMGFNRRQAIAALEDNQFDLERAANALLSVNN